MSRTISLIFHIFHTSHIFCRLAVGSVFSLMLVFPVALTHAQDLDNNPPGRRGGPGTNWENPPGLVGGPGTSPNRGGRRFVRNLRGLRDLDNNPPGPRGGRGTNWENPPGRVGGPGASPNRRRR
jgi:hypothetical protein